MVRGRGNHPRVHRTDERRAVAHPVGPVGPVAVVVFRGTPHPVRSGLHRHGLLQPLRIRGAQEAPPADTPQRRTVLPAPAPTGAVDRHPGACADRPADLGPSQGPVGPQRRHVLSPEQEERLPAALPVEVRHLRAGHPRILLCSSKRQVGPSLLQVRWHGRAHDGTGRAMPAGTHRCRRAGTGGVGPHHRPARQLVPTIGAVRAVCRRS